MEVELLFYRQLKAKDIYITEKNSEKWNKLYASFKGYPQGIYFYTFGLDALSPFYIGKCTAKSYNIVGRVWSELDDYHKGKYWLPRNMGQLRELDCFKKSTLEGQRLEENFFPPVSGSTMPNEEDEALKKFMDEVWITFAAVLGDIRNEEDDRTKDFARIEEVEYSVISCIFRRKQA
jgi:hypothetical protein